MTNWKKLFLKYFDVNQNGKMEWWEYMVPFIIYIIVDLFVEILANLITG